METTPRPRSLRVAIVSGNTIVEERLVRARDPVTIGPSPRDTFVVPASDELPRSFALFAPGAAGWELRVTRAMSGKVALDDKMEPLALDELLRTATRQGDLYRIQLGPRGRGRIAIGDLTVLYQLVEPPPALPKPQLPPSLRGSPMKNLDRAMIAVVALSLIAHTGVVAYARTLDFPRTPDIERLPDRRISQFLLPRPVEKPTPKPERVDPNRHPVSRPVTTRPHVAVRPVPSVVESQAERHAELGRQVARHGLLQVITARGEGDEMFKDIIRPDPGNDADRVFQNVSDVVVGNAAPSPQPLQTHGAPGPTHIGGLLRVKGPEDVDNGNTVERHAPKGEWIPKGPIDIPDPSLAQIITAEVKKRKGAITACYERSMHGGEALAGKIQLRFTLSPIGKVTATEIEDDTVGDEGLARCMRTTVGGWRFPELKRETEFSYPFIFQESRK
jgi:hypothetical protein